MDPVQQSLPHEIGGITDTLRFGLAGVKSDILISHPVQVIQENVQKQQREMKRNILAKAYGSAFPLKMDIEQQILSRVFPVSHFVDPSQAIAPAIIVSLCESNISIFTRFQRPPGELPSSMLGLESLTGSLDEFSFEDYLNDPRESETFVPADMHHGMEVRLGLSKGPVCRSFM